MNPESKNGASQLRYQADETPPVPLTLGLGLQLVALTLAVPILIPTAIMRTAGMAESDLAWPIFAAVVISGMTTALQAFRFGWIGGGHLLVAGSSGAFIGIAITALAEGGPALLATLVAVTAIVQLLFSARLALFRRILTPAVSGAVIMILPVTVMPFVFEMLETAPEGNHQFAAPATAAVTILAILGVSLKGSAILRLWAPIIGVVAGSAFAAFFGLFELDRIASASWIGVPKAALPGLDLDFGPVFLSLLPVFLLTGLVGSIRAISSNIALQRVSWRRQRPTDFRAVQGTTTLDGLGNLVCGLAGTVPNTTYSLAAPLIEINGVASRLVAVATGGVFLAVAFMPKALAVILSIPGPVVAAYLFVLITMLFMIGVSMVMQEGMDYRKGLIVGFSFWLGLGVQNGAILPEILSQFAGGVFSNGITTGGLAAILLTWFVEATAPRPSRMETGFSISALTEIREFLENFSSGNGWDTAMSDRLTAVAEETLLSLLGPDAQQPAPEDNRRLRLSASRAENGAVLEFIAGSSEANLQEQISLLDSRDEEAQLQTETSLRLLRHLGASVRHQQYIELDIVTVNVKRPDSG